MQLLQEVLTIGFYDGRLLFFGFKDETLENIIV